MTDSGVWYTCCDRITPGTDLVEWQLRVAAGEPLPLSQDQIVRRGHAVECRVYAEEPGAGFLPRAGTLHRLVQPQPEEHVRVRPLSRDLSRQKRGIYFSDLNVSRNCSCM